MEGFSFVQITDHHLGDHPGHLRRGYATNFVFELTLRQIADAAHSIDFLLSTGDLVDPPTPAGYACLRATLGIQNSSAAPGPLYMNFTGLQGLPFYAIPGNHDDRPIMAASLFASGPVSAVNAAFDHKGVQFICLDWGPEAAAVSSPELWQFLGAALARDIPSVIISHHAVTAVGARWLDDFVAADIDRFWDLITAPPLRGRVLGILCGHTHITYAQVVENIPVLGLRSTCYSFALADQVQYVIDSPHYRLLNIQDGVLTSRVYEVPLPSSARLDSAELR